jgi:ribosomal protein S18 acetylase RimI-like enzyme
VSDIEVRRADEDDIPALTGVLARAFSNDPPMCWVFRDDTTRTSHLERLFDGGLREVFLPNDASYTTTDLAGCALWAPPGRWKTPDEVVERLAPQMAEFYTPEELGRLLTFFAMQEEHHPTDAEHWYLGVLAADPARQGQGIGSACMRPIIDQLDRDGVPAYLESSNERNVPLYERHGFRVTGIIDLPDDGPPIWHMWRDPR